MALLVVAGLAAGSGCGSKAPTAIVISVTSEAPPPEVDSMELQVDRGSSTPFFQPFAIPSEAKLPGTLTLDGSKEDNDKPITISVVAFKGGKKLVLKRATLRMSEGKTKLLRLPLRFACFETADCNAGETCGATGACIPDTVDGAALPEYTPELVFGVQGVSSTCFDDRTTLATACLASPVDVDVNAFFAAQCTMELSSQGGAGGMSGTGSGGASPVDPAGGTGGSKGGLADGPAGAKLNVALHWKRSAVPTSLTVLDRDDQEGWSFTAKGGFQLPTAMCTAAVKAAVSRVVYSTACAPKPASRPICQAPVGAGIDSGSGSAGAATGGTAGMGQGGAAAGMAGAGGMSMVKLDPCFDCAQTSACASQLMACTGLKEPACPTCVSLNGTCDAPPPEYTALVACVCAPASTCKDKCTTAKKCLLVS